MASTQDIHVTRAISIETNIEQAAEVLWGWSRADGCNEIDFRGYPKERCITRRASRLDRFFDFYKDITASWEVSREHINLVTENYLLRVFRLLQNEPHVPRRELVSKIPLSSPTQSPKLEIERGRILDLAVKCMFMINCSSRQRDLGCLEYGRRKIEWRQDAILAQFGADTFPISDHPAINDPENLLQQGARMSNMARKLKKHAGLSFRPTDDLRIHLKLNQRTGVVEIFHHTAFLKEHLKLTRESPKDISMVDTLKRAALPRQLALEVLDPIQKVLFPLSDPKSYSLLLSLTSTSSFDPDCLRFESTSIRKDNETSIKYLYFGSRLADLYEELENPKPRGWIERWLERKSRARHVKMATVVGVVTALFLGFASLAVRSYQAWVGYQQ